jgi:hypothetical protein
MARRPHPDHQQPAKQRADDDEQGEGRQVTVALDFAVEGHHVPIIQLGMWNYELWAVEQDVILPGQVEQDVILPYRMPWAAAATG